MELSIATLLRLVVLGSSVLTAIALHTVWGASDLIWPDQMKITAVYPGTQIVGHQVMGVLLLVCAVTAAMGLYRMTKRSSKPRDAWWFAPQQAVMLFSAAGEVQAIATATYADGTYIGSSIHIFNDQFVYLLVTAVHTIALYYFHWSPEGRRILAG